MTIFSINLKTKIFPKNVIQINSVSLYHWNFMQNIRKVLQIILYKTWKPNFGTLLAPFGCKTPKQNFPQNKIYASFETICYSNFLQKIRKNSCFHFSPNFEKPDLSYILGLFGLKTPDQDFLLHFVGP